MHIVIDARMISARVHGISRHVWNLIGHLSPSRNDYTLLVHSDFLRGKTPFRLKKISSPWLSWTEQIELPIVLSTLKCDLFHSPSFVIPFYSPVPFIITIHDMNHLALKTSWLHFLYYRTILKRGIAKAKAIITVSNFSKKEILKYYAVDERKIHVFPNGLDPKFKPVLDSNHLSKIQNRYHLPKEFLLYIGNPKPHKNFDFLVKAYLKSQTSLPLVALGISNIIRPDIICLPLIDDADLPALYTLSHAVLFPSTYEGFGFPALEALACEKPLITSTCASLAEIVDDAALQIDPHDTNAWARAIKKVSEGSPHNHKGLGQAQKFSLVYQAAKTEQLYER